jgi:hypothetical protein
MGTIFSGHSVTSSEVYHLSQRYAGLRSTPLLAACKAPRTVGTKVVGGRPFLSGTFETLGR